MSDINPYLLGPVWMATPTFGGNEMTGKYRIELILKRGLRQRWFWRLIDTSNGQTLAHSENYSRRVDAMTTATQLATALGTTPVVLGKP